MLDRFDVEDIFLGLPYSHIALVAAARTKMVAGIMVKNVCSKDSEKSKLRDDWATARPCWLSVEF